MPNHLERIDSLKPSHPSVRSDRLAKRNLFEASQLKKPRNFIHKRAFMGPVILPKTDFLPFPTTMLVQAEKRAISVASQGNFIPFHGRSDESQECQIHLRRKALPRPSSSYVQNLQKYYYCRLFKSPACHMAILDGSVHPSKKLHWYISRRQQEIYSSVQ